MRKLRVTVLFDYPGPPPEDQDYSAYLKTMEEAEFEVAVGLRKLGHKVSLLGFYDDVSTIIDGLRAQKPDLVFNGVESFKGDFTKDSRVAGLLDLLDIPYTGSGPEGLMLARDKGQSKKVLAYHKVHVPAFKVFRRRSRARRLAPLTFPLFVKPLDQDGSFAIAQASVVEDQEQFAERLDYVHKRLERDAIVEQHIRGREFYVGLLGNAGPRALPVIEMKFENPVPGHWKIATHKAKWDEAYRKRRGIKNVLAGYLPEETTRRLQNAAVAAFRSLHIRDYGRADFRMTEDGTIYMIEMNPNPYLAEEEDFMRAARSAGIKFNDVVQIIVEETLKRARRS